MQLILFSAYLFLACFNAGNMVTLQIQHYGIYHFVGKEHFRDYMKANNKAAAIPSILPAMLLLLISIVLLFYRPHFMTLLQAVATFAFNIIAFVSTFMWQRKLQSEMAASGYDKKKVDLLIATNRVRTMAFLVQAILAVYIVTKAAG